MERQLCQCQWSLRRLVRLWVWGKHGGCWKCDQRRWIRTGSFTLLCCIVCSVKNLWTPGGADQCGLNNNIITHQVVLFFLYKYMDLIRIVTISKNMNAFNFGTWQGGKLNALTDWNITFNVILYSIGMFMKLIQPRYYGFACVSEKNANLC